MRAIRYGPEPSDPANRPGTSDHAMGVPARDAWRQSQVWRSKAFSCSDLRGFERYVTEMSAGWRDEKRQNVASCAPAAANCRVFVAPRRFAAPLCRDSATICRAAFDQWPNVRTPHWHWV